MELFWEKINSKSQLNFFDTSCSMVLIIQKWEMFWIYTGIQDVLNIVLDNRVHSGQTSTILDDRENNDIHQLYYDRQKVYYEKVANRFIWIQGLPHEKRPVQHFSHIFPGRSPGFTKLKFGNDWNGDVFPLMESKCLSEWMSLHQCTGLCDLSNQSPRLAHC